MIGDRRLSVSLWSVVFVPTEKGTKLITVEDGAFLDGLDNAESRSQGIDLDMDGLEKYLAETEAVPV